jgi:two-component system chemotaxis response regulator CheY
MPKAQHATVKLLIVDDSNIIRRRIERDIHLPGLEVVGTAHDGLEAVRLFKTHLPDVATVDLTMPRMDGLETIAALLAIKPDTRILVISALADKATAIKAIRLGANGFLNKPFNEAELNAALRELLEFARPRS